MRKLFLGLLLSVFCVTMAAAQIVPPVTYNWSAPTTGSEVVLYNVELNENGGPWNFVGTVPDTTYTFTDWQYLTVYSIRVQGRDALDRLSPFSTPSEDYLPDLGAPGPPGQPVRVSP
jgi:hypothetical protein